MTKYTDLIPNRNFLAPLYEQHVDLSTRIFVDINDTLGKWVDEFDVDQATGEQLDIVAKWVGATRTIQVAINDTFFSWDTDRLGWDEARWLGQYESPYRYVTVGDDLFRTLIKLKIAINNWDGTNGSIPDVLATALRNENFTLAVLDNQDMTESEVIVGGQVNDQLSAALKYGDIVLRPAGVWLKDITRPSDEIDGSENDYIFAFDLENDLFRGLDEGAWAEEI
ncbi:hypothetical protein R84981_002810 [Carnimonas sp. R-84981]|uniref:DUF2612 domain-containing protein n=1 Tax=Carnimonas bestiolae TaxID=3402172 RepID=UPI003EDC1D6E